MLAFNCMQCNSEVWTSQSISNLHSEHQKIDYLEVWRQPGLTPYLSIGQSQPTKFVCPSCVPLLSVNVDHNLLTIMCPLDLQLQMSLSCIYEGRNFLHACRLQLMDSGQIFLLTNLALASWPGGRVRTCQTRTVTPEKTEYMGQRRGEEEGQRLLLPTGFSRLEI